MNPTFAGIAITVLSIVGIILFTSVITQFARVARDLHKMEFEEFGSFMSSFILLGGMLVLDGFALLLVIAAAISTSQGGY